MAGHVRCQAAAARRPSSSSSSVGVLRSSTWVVVKKEPLLVVKQLLVRISPSTFCVRQFKLPSFFMDSPNCHLNQFSSRAKPSTSHLTGLSSLASSTSEVSTPLFSLRSLKYLLSKLAGVPSSCCFQSLLAAHMFFRCHAKPSLPGLLVRSLKAPQRAWPTVCAPDSATRSFSLKPLFLKLLIWVPTLSNGLGRRPICQSWAGPMLSRRPRGTSYLGPPARLTASRVASARMSAQETDALHRESSCTFCRILSISCSAPSCSPWLAIVSRAFFRRSPTNSFPSRMDASQPY
ncbi:hypothetical protein EJB05_40274, partial [Eragrostis curvula]